MKLTLPLKADCECAPVDPNNSPVKDPKKPVKDDVKEKSKAEQQAQEYLEKYGNSITVPLKEMDTSGILDKNASYTKESASGFSKTTHSSYSSESSVSRTSGKSSVRYSEDYGVTSMSEKK